MNFNKRLSLLGYMRKQFGVFDIHKPISIRTYYQQLNEKTEGAAYHADGISKLCRVLQYDSRVTVPADKLLEYDANIARHVEKINKYRQRKDQIVFKYFQLLAGFYTEYYLDQLTSRKKDFLDELNAFVQGQQENHRSKVQYSTFEEDDLNKLAFWMATGSGKTLIMHLNYYQFLHYQPRLDEKPDNILLITPNAGLTHQHTQSMEKSGIPCQYYLDANGGSGIDPETVRLIEITKLVDDKAGEGDSIEVSEFEGNNLVFVDEGHKGSGTEDSKWMRRRKEIAKDGFTFEYSATFGQAMSNAAVGVQDEYGKAILFDYSYPRFYDDGYGKDYRILNLKEKQTFENEQQQVYLLANLLTFFEQKSIYNQQPDIFYKTWNIRQPLLTFIGHSVQAGRTKSGWLEDEKKTVSDVQRLILFLGKVLNNENDWSTQTIQQILEGDSGVNREDGSDLFEDSFTLLKSRYGSSSNDLFNDLLKDIFHLDGPAPLKLTNLTSADGEIGLRAGNSESFFGVINIGEDSNFLSYIEEELTELTVEEPNAFESSLFQKINAQHSPVNILIGSKKFIEGWSSWRVSCMGLMNIGKSEGPQIIQLFGRGVRLLGKDRSLKRSSEMKNVQKPSNIDQLETLQIFGLQANYMEQFRDYLEDEGIDTDRRIELNLDIKLKDNFEDKGLLVIKPKERDDFKDVRQLVLEVSEDIMPRIDLTASVQERASDDRVEDQAAAPDGKSKEYIPDNLIPLLDTERIYREAWYYRSQKGYDNLSFTRKETAEILRKDFYELYCDKSLLEPTNFRDIKKIEQVALSIVRKYIDTFYKKKQQEWEYTQLEYQSFDSDDPNIPHLEEAKPGYQLRVKEEAVDKLEKEIKALFEDEELLKKDVTSRNEGKLPRIYLDRHIYYPLLIEDEKKVIESTPVGLNEGEWKFVNHLKEYFDKPRANDLLEGFEVYVIRNQSRGHGVGFLLEGERFFPDFIVWLKNDEEQHICFMDPKGLQHQINVDENNKVQFSKDIKEYEKQINENSGRDDILLHSFIISQTDFKEVRKNNAYNSEVEYNELGLFFPKDDLSYIDSIFREILNEDEEVSYVE
jgi:hypothetical protein